MTLSPLNSNKHVDTPQRNDQTAATDPHMRLAEPSIVAIDQGTCRTEPVQRPSPPVAAGASLELGSVLRLADHPDCHPSIIPQDTADQERLTFSWRSIDAGCPTPGHRRASIGTPLEPTPFSLPRCSDLSPRPTIVCGRNHENMKYPLSKCGGSKGIRATVLIRGGG